MCFRCLREGFVDDFPWPDRSGNEETEEEAVQGGLLNQIVLGWLALRTRWPSGLRIGYGVPIFTCAITGKWPSGLTFSFMLFFCLTISDWKNGNASQLLAAKRKKKKQKKNSLLCTVISTEMAKTR